jgi:hypothetical protein
MSEPTFIEVNGHYSDETVIRWQKFGVIPDGFTGETDDLPFDEDVMFWLEADEPVVVGREYGDFVVTEVLA